MNDHASLVLRELLLLQLARPVEHVQGAQLDTRLRASYFLFDDDVLQFATSQLPALMQQLRRRVHWQDTEHAGIVRGRIIWPATLHARQRRSQDPTRFVCRRARNQYDTPENQLLKYVVTAIASSVQMLPPAIRAGTRYTASVSEPSHPVVEVLRRLEAVLDDVRRNPHFREVSLPRAIDARALHAVAHARAEVYAGLVQLYKRHCELVRSADRRALWRSARRGLVLPATLGSEGEPWLRFAASVLSGDLPHA